VWLDVTDDASVVAAARIVEDQGGLDVLVNNAGIAPEWTAENEVVGAPDLTADLMRHTFDTNVVGTVRVLHAFLPLLSRSAAPVVVNVSSGLASLSRAADSQSRQHRYPGVAYPA
jgi:NAD(P)-dependent dehydrogenase (short-subunit alcohol dehydrogenase family)